MVDISISSPKDDDELSGGERSPRSPQSPRSPRDGEGSQTGLASGLPAAQEESRDDSYLNGDDEYDKSPAARDVLGGLAGGFAGGALGMLTGPQVWRHRLHETPIACVSTA